MIIREERKEEYPLLYDFIKTAFATAAVSDGDEQDFTDRLRARSGYIPQLALVAEQDGEIVAHIMMTRFNVASDCGSFEILIAAPLSVALDYRGRGIGAELMGEACRKAKEMGFRAVMLIGDPNYYSRFGYRPSVGFGIGNADGIPEQYVQILELEEGSLSGIKGMVTFAGM